MAIFSARRKPVVPEPTPAEQAAHQFVVDMQDRTKFYAYVSDPTHADARGDVTVPVVGTMCHLFGMLDFLDDGATITDLDLVLYQDTADYSPAFIREIKNLLISRLTHGYPGTEVEENDTPYKAAQRVCRNLFVGVRGFTVITADSKRINVVPDWQA